MAVTVSGERRAQPSKGLYDEIPSEATRGFTRFDAAVLGSVALSVTGNLISARLAAGWPTSVALTAAVGIYFAGLSLNASWRVLLGRLFLVGFTAGVVELFTDAAGEGVVHSLSYPAGEPMIWASPFYMPLAWALVLMQLGYFGWRLRGLVGPQLSIWGAVAIAALGGALLVPFDEEMAFHAGWWQYAPAPGIGHTPFYVVLFEGAIAAVLPLILFHIERRRVSYAVAVGLILGAWMPCAALASWLLIGRG